LLHSHTHTRHAEYYCITITHNNTLTVFTTVCTAMCRTEFSRAARLATAITPAATPTIRQPRRLRYAATRPDTPPLIFSRLRHCISYYSVLYEIFSSLLFFLHFNDFRYWAETFIDTLRYWSAESCHHFSHNSRRHHVTTVSSSSGHRTK